MAAQKEYLVRQGWAEARWTCSNCEGINSPGKVVCRGCQKQRWSQLGIGQRDALAIAKQLEKDASGPEEVVQ
jgi:hypothetical protein